VWIWCEAIGGTIEALISAGKTTVRPGYAASFEISPFWQDAMDEWLMLCVDKYGQEGENITRVCSGSMRPRVSLDAEQSQNSARKTQRHKDEIIVKFPMMFIWLFHIERKITRKTYY
jgi:hypothetical protein